MRALLVPFVIVALAVLGGCAQDEPTPGPAGPATALTLPPSTTPSSAAAVESEVAQCADGNCEVTLTEDTDIDVDGATVRVSDIDGDRARLRIEGPRGGTSTSSGSSALVVNNDLTVRMQVADGMVTLEISSG